MLNDAALLHRYIADHSDHAFGELLSRHINLVYSVALRTVGGDAHSAQDVSQAVFIALARNAASLAQRQTLAGWLYLTTHHIAAQAVRASCRRQNREHQAHLMNDISNAPDVEWDRLRPVLDEAMGGLDGLDREAILLRFFEKRPFADIGAALRLKEDAARMRVDRAMEKLRALLARRGIKSTATALALALGNQVVAAPAGLAASIAGAVATLPVSSGFALHLLTRFMTPTHTVSGTLVLAAAGAAFFFSGAGNKNVPKPVAALGQPVVLPAEKTDPKVSPQIDRHENARDQTANKSAVAPNVENGPDRFSDRVESEAWIQRLVASYDPLLSKLQLSAAQIDSFRALVRENLRIHGDLRIVARAERLQPGDPDVESISLQADIDLAKRVRTEFGEPAFEAFQHFNETAPIREFTHHVAEALTATSTPLSAEQAEILIELLHRNRTRSPAGGLSNHPRAFELDAVIAQAGGVLSDPQIEVLRRVYAELR